MAQGNMFRKQRSVSRAANPMGISLFYPQGSQRPNLQTSSQRPMVPNPIAPAAAEAQANAAFMRGNPGFGTSSLDATQRFNGLTANNAFQSSMVNGYVGQAPVSSPFDEHASRARAQEYMRGGPAADPTNLAGRFGNVAPRISDEQRRAQDYATSQAAMAERMRTQMPTDRAQNVFVKPSRDGKGLAYTDRGQALRNMPENTPGLADAISLDDAQRQASMERMAKRLEDYKAANGGMNAQAVGRQRRQERREQGKYDKAIGQGMNPMSSQAQAMFPEQTKSFMEQRKANRGAAIQNPMAPASNTPAGRQQAAADVANQAASDLNIQSLGVDPAAGTVGLHLALSNRMAEDPELEFDDNTLQSYQKFAASAFKADPGMGDPSKYTNAPFDVFINTEGAVNAELWKELAGLPDNPRSRQQWLDKYKNRQQEIDRRTEQGYGVYGS